MSLSVAYNEPLVADGDWAAESEVVSADAMIRSERSTWQPVYFGIPVVAALVSYLAGGIALLNDFAWLTATVLCVVFLIAEFRAFSFRWGLGAMTFYGGCLVWLSYDYMRNWFGLDYVPRATGLEGLGIDTLSKATLAHMLMLPMVVVGMRISFKGRLEGLISKLPGPRSSRMWMILIVALVAFGLTPYAFFTREGLILSVWNDFWAGRAGGGAAWTTGRTGNANYSYGAYLAQVLQVGTFGAVLATYYIAMIARTWVGRIVAFLLWLPWFMLAFGTGTRGNVVFLMIPAVGFLFIRFQAEAAAVGKRISLRAYLWMLALLAVTAMIVQTQIAFRGEGFKDADLGAVSVTKLEGNAMFSESLTGFAYIPETRRPYYDQYPGQAMITPPFDTLFWMVVTPIPRALWTSKPIDETSIWYNKVVGGSKDGIEGTTISNGYVGFWFFRYGWFGPLWGGVITGFVLGVAERLLRVYADRPLAIITALAVATWQFRNFRGWSNLEFHPVLVGLAGVSIFYLVLRTFLGETPEDARETA